MTVIEMILSTLFYSPFNQVTRLLARESFIVGNLYVIPMLVRAKVTVMSE